MFNHVGKSAATNGIPLVFLKSLNVHVYPCGRRRSLIQGTTTDTYIPFDPEARLTTEANIRSSSGLNGFTQTYVKNWSTATDDMGFDEKRAVISLDGYLFTINLADINAAAAPNGGAAHAFGAAIITKAGELDSSSTAGKTKIYANIIIVDVPLYDGAGLSYSTSVLCGQDTAASENLDLLADAGDENQASSYYFSGLSFSTEPLTSTVDGTISDTTRSVVHVDGPSRRIISLCILELVDDKWQIHQPALLPAIEHGDTEDSVKFGSVSAESVSANSIKTDELKLVTAGATTVVPSLTVVETGDKYRLKFSGATVAQEAAQ